jgi:hypothetical protein
MSQTTEKSDKHTKIQCLPVITLSGLFTSAINGIVGFIAVYLFQPIWKKFVNLWEKNKDQS